jgi:hypothetical protein
LAKAILQWIFWTVGLVLQARLLASLWPNRWRKFPTLFFYLILLFTTTIFDIVTYHFITDFNVWSACYWTAEILRQSVLFMLVVSFGVAALPETHARQRLVHFVAGLAVLYWFATVGLLQNDRIFEWMTAVVRNLSFGSAILNLAVWFLLILWRKRDVAVLLLSGGLGLQMTGEAIGQSLRQLFPQQAVAGSILTVLAHLLCMLIWLRAVRYSNGSPRVLEAANSH